MIWLYGRLDSKKEVTGGVDGKVHVDDELEYKIKLQNKVENGLIKDVRIVDKLPSGVEYIAGSLKMNGNLLTDDVDEDAGSYEDNTVKVNFGDVLDTEERIVTFKVKVTKESLKTKEIENIAIVEGKTPDDKDFTTRKANCKNESGSEGTKGYKDSF